jgi:predicted ATPase/DNA-binding CsgD family transcriptional regulator
VAPRRPAALPNQLSSFVGRAAQIDEVATLLRSGRLVTLTGCGGIGKTRLALEIAGRMTQESCACCWVTLSSAMDDAGVTRAIATASGSSEPLSARTLETLAASIGEQNLLLVVDNCEQVITACADLLVPLLQHCPGVRVLATSREALGVPGEMIYPVPPLAITAAPYADYEPPTEAVQLFFERAQARDPRLRLTPEARALAVRICSACDGVPLAIELAAACTGSMTFSEIADRLEDALGLLKFGARGVPARQRSLRASIDWSHQLLASNEQILLRRLAAFEAEFTQDGAQAVCSFDALETVEVSYLLDRLVAQSLVHASRHGTTTRFSMWTPVRQYGRELLQRAGEAERVQTRLVEWSDLRGTRSAIRGPLVSVALTQTVFSEAASERTPTTTTKARRRRHDGLSDREHDVVQLIADGRSNREIADELVITRKTAEAHVSHILTKLGLCSRVQVATWSLRQCEGVLHVRE